MRRLVLFFDRIYRINRIIGNRRFHSPTLRISFSPRSRRQASRPFDPEAAPRHTSVLLEASRRRDGRIHIVVKKRRKHCLRHSPFPIPRSPFCILHCRAASHRRRHRHPCGGLHHRPFNAGLAFVAGGNEKNYLPWGDMFLKLPADSGFGGNRRVAGHQSDAENPKKLRHVEDQRGRS